MLPQYESRGCYGPDRNERILSIVSWARKVSGGTYNRMYVYIADTIAWLSRQASGASGIQSFSHILETLNIHRGL